MAAASLAGDSLNDAWEMDMSVSHLAGLACLFGDFLLNTLIDCRRMSTCGRHGWWRSQLAPAYRYGVI